MPVLHPLRTPTTKRSNKKASQFWRVVNGLKKQKRSVLKSIREDPGICPVCSMVNPALHSYAIRNALNVEPFLRTESLQLRWSGHVSTVEQGCTTASVWLAALRPPVSFRCFYLICIASVLLPHVCLGRLSTNCPHTAGQGRGNRPPHPPAGGGPSHV